MDWQCKKDKAATNVWYFDGMSINMLDEKEMEDEKKDDQGYSKDMVKK